MFKFKDDVFYEPDFRSLVISFYLETITLSLFTIFFDTIGTERTDLQIKYLYNKKCVSNLFLIRIFHNIDFFYFLRILLNGEKTYGVSFFAYNNVFVSNLLT